MPNMATMPGMTLRDWLQTSGKQVAAFSAEVGIPLRTLYRYISHERLPRGETMAAIVRATNGAVRPNDFFDAVPSDPAEAV